MNVMPKDVAAVGFDEAAWREELLALNPWARGLTIDENNAEFAAARQKATLARHAESKEVWNAWANAMLAQRSALEAGGQWTAKRVLLNLVTRGQNKATRMWLALASAVFSTQAAPHCFDLDVSFDDHTFCGDADFRGATFLSAQFWDAIFSGNAEFVGATFGNAEFQGATFLSVANFHGATIKTTANFVEATFSGWARFEGATFSGGADFRGASFSGLAGFGNGTFSGDAKFGGATFEAGTDMSGVRFNRQADLALAKFQGPVTFANSVFRQSASFEAIESTAAFSLADAAFRQVPSFIGASFKGLLRLDNVRTPPYRLLGYTPDRDATARFRELRRRAGEVQDRDRELEFFAQEVRTGRFHAKGLPSWLPKVWSWRFWFGLAFEAFSDFGRSLWRPLLTWVALAALFAAFYLGEHEDVRKARADLGAGWSTLGAYAATTAGAYANPPACRVEGREPFASTDAVAEAIQLSLRNALVFDIGRTDSARRTLGCLFGLEKDGDQQYLRVPARVSMVSTFQALASGLLIFLFLLAARNLLRLR